jgi:hypothetical protein
MASLRSAGIPAIKSAGTPAIKHDSAGTPANKYWQATDGKRFKIDVSHSGARQLTFMRLCANNQVWAFL